jgi:type IV pilus assembly protein PilE
MDHLMKQFRACGFTLIEMMVTVAIIALVAAIAYPNYTDSVRKNKRASAKAEMAEVALRLQQYYSEKQGAATYTTVLTELNYPAGALYSQAKGHVITIAAGSTGIASSYTIRATPLSTDQACGTLTLNHLGAYAPDGC